MSYVDRVSTIKAMLVKDDKVSVQELSEAFGVSGQTIRRDLKKISQNDPTIIRAYGGAYRVKPDCDPPYTFRQNSKTEEKKRIADKCMEKIEDGDFIFLDSSTTTLFLAKNIAVSGLDVTVITNSLGVLNELCGYSNIKLRSVGGRYSNETHSFVGAATVEALSALYAAKAFVSCSGIDLNVGLTHNNDDEAAILKTMIKNSSERYFLIDSNKFGRRKTHRVIPLAKEHIDMIYTDSLPNATWLEQLTRNEIPVEICDQ